MSEQNTNSDGSSTLELDPSQNGHGKADGSHFDSSNLENKSGEEGLEQTTSESGDDSSEGTEENNSAGNESAQIELRKKLTEQGDQIAGYQDLIKIASEHPDWTFKQILGYVQHGTEPSSQTEVTDPFEDLYDSLVGDKKENREALATFAERVSQRTEERLLQKLKPVINRTFESDVTNKFVKGLRSTGLDPEIVEDDAFQEFKTSYERENNSWFNAVAKADPVQAGKFVGEAYTKKIGAKNGFKKQQDKVNFAKDAILEKTGSKGGSTQKAANTVTLPRTATMQQIRPFIAAGKKVIFK